MHEMPIALNVCRLYVGDGMVSTLVGSKARYNDSCRLKFNNTKLKRTEAKEDNQLSPGGPSNRRKLRSQPTKMNSLSDIN